MIANGMPSVVTAGGQRNQERIQSMIRIQSMVKRVPSGNNGCNNAEHHHLESRQRRTLAADAPAVSACKIGNMTRRHGIARARVYTFQAETDTQTHRHTHTQARATHRHTDFAHTRRAPCLKTNAQP